jgi:hypothetical protein
VVPSKKKKKQKKRTKMNSYIKKCNIKHFLYPAISTGKERTVCIENNEVLLPYLW